VEPDYLPDLEVFYFQLCLYPMKYLHPISMYNLPCRGVQRGGTPSAGLGGYPPGWGVWEQAGPQWGFEGSVPQRKNCLVNVYCNFIVIWTVHYKVRDLTIEIMLGFFSLEGNPLLYGKYIVAMVDDEYCILR
jgi:hypothetical protein